MTLLTLLLRVLCRDSFCLMSFLSVKQNTLLTEFCIFLVVNLDDLVLLWAKYPQNSGSGAVQMKNGCCVLSWWKMLVCPLLWQCTSSKMYWIYSKSQGGSGHKGLYLSVCFTSFLMFQYSKAFIIPAPCWETYFIAVWTDLVNNSNFCSFFS